MKFQKLFHDWQDVVEHKTGDTIFSAGDKAEFLYFLMSGEVELNLHGQSLEKEGPGGIIGEMATVQSSVQNATATAISDVRLARMDRKSLKKVINANNGFSFRIMSTLAKRLRAVDEFIIDQMKQNN